VIYAIISDIHSNLEALEATRDEIARIAPHKVVCLGDLVGYGGSPSECVEGTRQLAEVTVAGNHDFGAVGLTDITYFNRYAREAIMWTGRTLTAEEKDYIRDLPLSYVEDGLFRMVHATPRDPDKWNYIFTHEQALEEFSAFPERICFIGHSHQPRIFELVDENTIIINSSHAKLRQDRRYLINVGSVGQPRDGDPRACLCLYDQEAAEVTIRRLEYDIEGAQKRIVEAGLPSVLARRLSWGE
jgi:diadenosine tetraphosphatase ApaH/serine/threonine PP2A family protein phosphatase